MAKTKVALLGAGFIADIHIESYHRFVPDAEVVAVYTRDPDRAQAFAKKHGIPQHYSDWQRALTESGCEVADV
jgi:predicted dehydrogenase